MAADGWLDIAWARRAQSREIDSVAGAAGFDPISLLFSLIAMVVIGTGRALRRVPLINPTQQRLLIGGRRLDFSDVDSAQLVVDRVPRSRDLWLRFGGSGVYLEALLRSGMTAELDAGASETLIGILEASSIVIPVDPYDPKGKFARSGFPTHVTKDEAIQLVRNPPMPGEPLPIIEP